MRLCGWNSPRRHKRDGREGCGSCIPCWRRTLMPWRPAAAPARGPAQRPRERDDRPRAAPPRRAGASQRLIGEGSTYRPHWVLKNSTKEGGSEGLFEGGAAVSGGLVHKRASYPGSTGRAEERRARRNCLPK